MDGKLEKTNEAYAISKIVGIKLSEILYKEYVNDVVCLMPTNVYGVNDNFKISSSHVIPGLITKFINAKIKNKQEVIVWGSGKPQREFLFVDDLASSILKILKTPKKKLNRLFKDDIPILNVGSGESISIRNLAKLIKELTDYKGKIIFDNTIPDGTINKDLNSSKISKLNWEAKIKLKVGLLKVINSRIK